MKIKEMCLCALFAILIGVGAFIKVPISIVPITLQTLFVILASLILRQKAVYSVLLYVCMGLIGLPVFTSGGGISYVLIPSFGYLIGFIVSSWFVGRYQNTNHMSLISRSCIGLVMIYIIGMLYFVFIQYVYYGQIFSLSWIFMSLCLVYLPGDLLSVFVSVVIYKRIEYLVPHYTMSSTQP
ncbi:biotin transporter BioY [Candidatus Stoquefichus sp. SB1]|uniref:biotin transporter BioY n=1 Tax=Candidatus Stoquefichus sp. SB1 TaxID=1658109 RepID=UPI00067F6F50|nr:biotin transporter BioY [Candidatus Stoquefichus sp. SB1]